MISNKNEIWRTTETPNTRNKQTIKTYKHLNKENNKTHK